MCSSVDERVTRILEAASDSGLQADAWFSQEDLRRVEAVGETIRDSEVSRNATLILRVWEDGRVGQIATSVVGEPEALLAMARTSARYGRRSSPEELPLRHIYPSVNTFDPAVDRLGLEELVKRTRELCQSGWAAVQGQMTVRGEIACATCLTSYSSTAGVYEVFTRTQYSSQIWASTAGDGEVLQYWNYLHSGQAHGAGVLTAPLAAQYERGRKTAPFSAGIYPVLLSPRVVVSLLQSLQRRVNSRLTQPDWEQDQLHPSITLTDQPLWDFAVGSAPFDDEGSPTQNKVLFRNGKQVDMLYDVQTGRAHGRSAGSGYRFVPHRLDRDHTALPQPWMSNLVLESGEESTADLVAGLDSGIWVDQLSGHGVANNRLQGHVKVGWLIRQGEVVGRIRNATILMNVQNALHSGMIGLSREREWTGGGRFLLPYVLAAEAQILNA